MDNDLRDMYDLYDADMEAGVPRQLVRLKYQLTPDAYDQLKEAFIFHYRAAWSEFWWQLRSILKLKCSVCGHRHVGTYRETYPSGGSLTCVFGLTYTWRYVFTTWRHAGKHGED